MRLSVARAGFELFFNSSLQFKSGSDARGRCLAAFLQVTGKSGKAVKKFGDTASSKHLSRVAHPLAMMPGDGAFCPPSTI